MLFAGFAHLLGAADRNHSIYSSRAQPDQLLGSDDGDRFRPVGRFFRRIDAERLQDRIVEN